ncbi:MAG: clostripain-related cysteine peptidase, partial [Bacteroidales bacterium]|nr:clostripain-related cysteine peptidase [Bacteroidales bacterium]
MRKIKYIAPLLILAISSLFISCEKNPFSGSEFRRVVVLYMAANNNLSSFAEHNISTIKDGFVPDKQSKDILVVYVHLPNKDPKLVRVYKESDGVVLEDIVATYTDQNSANGDVLKAVLNKIKVIFPAKEYGLILWSHATGWLPQGYFNTSVNQGAFYEDPYKDIVKSFGEDRGVEMEVKEL